MFKRLCREWGSVTDNLLAVAHKFPRPRLVVFVATKTSLRLSLLLNIQCSTDCVGSGDRTHDPRLMSPVLYQLSYPDKKQTLLLFVRWCYSKHIMTTLFGFFEPSYSPLTKATAQRHVDVACHLPTCPPFAGVLRGADSNGRLQVMSLMR